jgi:hypothetical protein
MEHKLSSKLSNSLTSDGAGSAISPLAGATSHPPRQSPDPKEVVYDHPFRTLGERLRSRHRRVRRDASGHPGDSHRHGTASRFKRQQRLFSGRQLAPIE